MESYPIIELRLKHGQNFRGNSLWSRITESNTYEVYSYGTLVATKQLDTGQTWVSTDKYSNTTSRGQNLIKRAWGLV